MDREQAINILSSANLGGVLREAAEEAVRALRGADLVPVLVVTVPAEEAVEEVQRRLCRELGERVLVLPEAYRWCVERLPGAVTVVPAKKERTVPAPLPEADQAAEKKAILERLAAYRRERGLGCLEDLAKAVRRRDVTADLLRSVLMEGRPMEMVQWRALRRGLDRLKKEKPLPVFAALRAAGPTERTVGI